MKKSAVLDVEQRNMFTSDNGCSTTARFEELAEKGHDPSYIFRGHKADLRRQFHHPSGLLEALVRSRIGRLEYPHPGCVSTEGWPEITGAGGESLF